MITYDEKVNFITYCLSELAVERTFSRPDNIELVESLYDIVTEGKYPLVWKYMPIELQEFYVNAGVNILEFKVDLLEEETPLIDKYVDIVASNLLEFIGVAAAQTAMLAMEPLFFAFDYESLNNKIGVCRKLKGVRMWKCQLGALKAARASARSSMGKCKNKSNPINCEKRVTSAIERIEKNIEKVQAKLKMEIDAERNRAKIKAQRELLRNARTDAKSALRQEAINMDFDSEEDPFEKIKADLKKGAKDKIDWAKQNKKKAAVNAAKITGGAAVSGTGMRLAKNFMNTRKALEVAKASQGVANATKAASLGLRTANLAKNAVKIGGVSIAASMLRKASIAVLSRKRMDICDRNFDGAEKWKCRTNALDGSIKELRKLLSTCGTDNKCKDKLNKAMLTAMKQRAVAKVKYDEARVYERNKGHES